jgi:hypothetical protein
MRRGLVLGGIQVLLALSVSGRFLYDRVTLPRAWARAAPVDPEMPIRGRYVRIQIELDSSQPLFSGSGTVELSVSAGRLVAKPSGRGLNVTRGRDGRWALAEPLAYFIPPGIPDPSVRKPGEELWVELSVPEQGAPRPLRLGVRRDGTLTPLEID